MHFTDIWELLCILLIFWSVVHFTDILDFFAFY